MDDTRRGADRADALCSLSRAIARGASQVLQQHMRGGASPMSYQAQGGGGREGGGVGDQVNLTRRCTRCDCIMPDGTRLNRKYCSDACVNAERQDDRRAVRQTIRAELIAGRRYQICGGPIPEKKFRGSKFCSLKCARSPNNPSQASRSRRPVRIARSRSTRGHREAGVLLSSLYGTGDGRGGAKHSAKSWTASGARQLPDLREECPQEGSDHQVLQPGLPSSVAASVDGGAAGPPAGQDRPRAATLNRPDEIRCPVPASFG